MPYSPKRQLEDTDARSAGRPHFAIAIALLLAALSLCEAQEAPKKPLRERLLERALKGDSEAQIDLAKGYEGGRVGLPQDFAQAAHWYLEAANRGDHSHRQAWPSPTTWDKESLAIT
jgi:TPR repeat protein